MIFIYLLLFYKSIQQDCKIIDKDVDDIFNQNWKSEIWIQSNEKNVSNINEIGYQMIEQTSQIKFNQNQIIIDHVLRNQYKIIKYQTKKNLLQEICFLIKYELHNNYYSINCTYIQQKWNEYMNLDDIQPFFYIQIKFQDQQCYKIQELDNNLLILICKSEQFLRIHKISLSDQNIDTITYYIEQNLNQCKINVEQIKQDIWIGFVECEEWIIYKFNLSSSISIYLNLTTFQNYINTREQLQLSYFQVCQQKVIFIFPDRYCINGVLIPYILDCNQVNLNTLNNKVYFKKILNMQSCSNYYFVFKSENNLIINNQIESNQSQIIYYDESANIQNIKTVILISKSDSLTVYVNKKLYQTYFLNITNLYVISQSTIFYIFDDIENRILFFKLHQHPKIFSTELKYIHLSFNFPHFEIEFLTSCFEIQLKSLPSFQNIINKNLFINNECQLEGEVILKKVYINLPYAYSMSQLKFNSQNISFQITDTILLEQICQSEYLKLKNIILFYYQHLSNIMIVKLDDILYIIDCNDQMLNEPILVKDYQIIVHQSRFILINNNMQEILIYFQLYQQYQRNQLQFKKKILNFQFFFETMVIYLENDEVPQILNLKNTITAIPKYLDENQFINGQIKFYYDNVINIIQYDDLILIIKQPVINSFQILNLTFINLLTFKNPILLLAVHDVLEILYLYTIQETELLQINYLEIESIKFYRPICYQTSNFKIVLLGQKNSQLYLIYYEICNKKIILKQIIKTSSSIFTLGQDFIQYLDMNGKLQCFDFENWIFKYQFLNSFQYNQTDVFDLDLQFVSQINQNEQPIVKTLQVYKKNLCMKLFPLFSSLQISINQSLQVSNNIYYSFNPQNLFFGLLEDFKIHSNTSVVLEGPFIVELEIKSCSQESEQICSKITQISSNDNKFEFHTILHQHKFIGISQYQDNILTLAISKNTYLILKVLDEQLIGLIIQYDEQQQNYLLHFDFLVESQFQLRGFQLLEIKNNLYSLKQDDIFIFHIYKDDKTYSLISITSPFLDIINIKDNNQMYVQLIDHSKQYFEIVICTLPQFQKSFSQLIEKELFLQTTWQDYEQIYYSNIELEIQNQKLKLINAMLNDQELQLNLIQISTYYGIQMKIIFNLGDSSIKYQSKSICFIRVPYEKMKQLYYLENQLFILLSDSLKYFIFDLTVEKSIYDSIHNFDFVNNPFSQLNSTHFFINDRKKFQSLKIVKYGFQLQFFQDSENNLEINLVASNIISNASIHLILEYNKNNSAIFGNYILIILLIFSLIIIAWFLYRRQRIKQKLQIIDQIDSSYQQ